MPSNKPKILLYWGYHRAAWTAPFLRLQEHFDFTYIFHYSKEDEILENDKVDVLYFEDFNSADELFDHVQPNKMIFLGLDGMLSISLNIAAKRRGIETILMQHGFVFHFKDEVRIEHYQNSALTSGGPVDPLLAIKRKHYRGFILKSLRLINWGLFVRYMLIKKRYGHESEPERMSRLKSKKRQADRYLLFAPFYKNLYEVRDHIQEEQISYFGNFEMDEFLKVADNYKDKGEYLLLVDQPLFHPHQSGGSSKCTYEEAERFYLKLSEFAGSLGLRLKVKLHPYSYGYADKYPRDDNMDIITEVSDLTGLLLESTGVFGFYSTLVLPAIYMKPTCLFKIMDDVIFFDLLKEKDFCEVQPFKNFDLSTFKARLSVGEVANEGFIEHFALSSDANSSARLKAILEVV